MRSRRTRDLGLQRVELICDAGGGVSFDRAITFDQVETERGELGVAAASSTRLRGRYRVAKAVIKLGHKQPGATIGHIHRAGGIGNRPMFLDQFEQPDLARTEPDLALDAAYEQFHSVEERSAARGDCGTDDRALRARLVPFIADTVKNVAAIGMSSAAQVTTVRRAQAH